MKATIVLDKLIIKSEVKAEDYQKAMEFDNELLSLKDENGDVSFVVLFKNGVSSFGKYGVTFGGVDDDNYPVAVLPLHGETKDEKLEEAAKLIMAGEKNLKAIEAKIRDAVPAAEEKLENIKEKITVIA